MITSFNEQLATHIQDVEVAILIENISYWIRKNAANQRNFHEGRYWSYNSYPAFAKLFPFWSDQKIRRIIKRAVAYDLLMIGHFNKKKFDNTNWYTLTDKALFFYPVISVLVLNTPVGIDRRPVGIDRPIPKELTTKENNTTTSEFSNSQTVAAAKPLKPKKQPSEMLRELIDCYRRVFPNNPQPHARVISTSLDKTLRTLIKRWPEIHTQGLPLTVEQFEAYLTDLKVCAPKFSLGEYETKSGHRKKNGLETFARWNTLVKHLEGSYT